MEKHEKIWVPVTQSPVPADSKTICGKFFRPAENIIVLSMEELRQFWDAAYAHGYQEGSNIFDQEDMNFETYLASKDISL